MYLPRPLADAFPMVIVSANPSSCGLQSPVSNAVSSPKVGSYHGHDEQSIIDAEGAFQLESGANSY